MRRGYLIALVFAGCLLAVARLVAQAPESGQGAPAAAGQKPAAAPPLTESNPFPTDTSNVPVLPAKREYVPGDDTYGRPENGSDARRFPLTGEDQDPVRSPDDAAPAAGSGQGEESSSSLTGLDSLLPRPGDDQTGKRKKNDTEIEPKHKETATEDINVGKYYMDNKDWKGALSRFQSALVLDPEEPEVYWGLAECERHLGDYANARANYQKIIDYDPGSRHARDAIKALREPEMANVKKPVDAQAATGTTK
jgi:tetratricopeptide (TPR) repeat protein